MKTQPPSQKSAAFNCPVVSRRIRIPGYLAAAGTITAALLASQPVFAASITWNNTGTDFNTGTYWSGNSSPGTVDNATFNGASVKNPNLSSSLTVQGITFETAASSGYALSSSGTNTKITLTNTGTSTLSAIYAANTSGINAISAPVILGGGAGTTQTFTQASSGTLAISGAISESGAATKLTYAGNGMFIISGANTYTGNTTIGDTSTATTIVNVQNSSAFGAGTGTVTVSAASALQVQGGITVNKALTLNGGGISSAGALVNVSGNNEWSGNIYLNSVIGTYIRITSNAGNLKLSGNISNNFGSNRVLTLQGNGSGEISGIISSNINVSHGLIGTGTWVLSGANTFTGSVSISNGSLSVSSINSVSGGKASSNLGAPTTAALGTISFGSDVNTGKLIYTGAGETTDRVINLAAIGNGGAIIDQSGSGLLKFSSDLTVTSTGTKTLTLQGSTTGTGEFGGAIQNGSSTVSLTKAGTGTWILSGSNSYTGMTSIGGGTLQLGNGGSTGMLATSGTITIYVGYVFAINRNNSVAQGTDFSSSAILGAGQFTQAGTGTTTLNAANTFSGAVNVNNGVLAFTTVASGAAAQALGVGSTVNLGLTGSSSGTLQYTGTVGTLTKNIYALGSGLNTVQNSSTSGLLTLSGSLVKNGTILVLNGGTRGINVTGVISGSNASYNSDLYVTGSSVTLSATNTYYGPTWVYGSGILVNGVTNALPTNTALVLGGTSGATDNSSNTYNLNGYNQTIASLTGTGSGTQTVTNDRANTTSTLTISGGGTFSGIIANSSGTTALAISGGNLVLGGINTYTGMTSVTGGTLTVNGSLAAGSAVNVTSATLAGSGTVGGTVSCTSAIINGSGLALGATTLHGNSTLAGANNASSVTIADGTTTVSGTTTAGFNVSSGATLAGSGKANGAVSVADGTVNGSGLSMGAATYSGASTLSGTTTASSITVASGTTSLTGNATSSGTLAVSAGGTLKNSGVATASNVHVSTGGSLTNNGTVNGNVGVSGLLNGNGTINGNLSLSGGTLAPGNSPGTTTVNGTYSMDAASTLSMQVTSGTTAGTYDQVVVSGSVTLAGTLDLSSLSTLTALGQSITLIVNNSGQTAVSEGFFGTVKVDGTSVALGADNTFSITLGATTTEYQLAFTSSSSSSDGTANDLTLMVVPEPSTWAMILGGIGMLAFGQRLRRRSNG